jgi:hypothetical protein
MPGLLFLLGVINFDSNFLGVGVAGVCWLGGVGVGCVCSDWSSKFVFSVPMLAY